MSLSTTRRTSWGGNTFAEDPQYGVVAPRLGDEGPAAATGDLAVFIGIVGDACDEISVPGVSRAPYRVSEGVAVSWGVDYLADQLSDKAAGAHVRYLIVAPTGRSFLRSARRRPADPALARVAAGYDQSVR